MTHCFGPDLLMLHMQRQLEAAGCCKFSSTLQQLPRNLQLAISYMFWWNLFRQVTISYLFSKYSMTEVYKTKSNDTHMEKIIQYTWSIMHSYPAEGRRVLLSSRLLSVCPSVLLPVTHDFTVHFPTLRFRDIVLIGGCTWTTLNGVTLRCFSTPWERKTCQNGLL